MQIFQRENSDVNEKFLPKISYIAKRIIIVYVSLIALCLAALKFAGMGWFDALCQSVSTVATGGFSTKNASIGAFHNPTIEWIITLFMFIGALPLTLYHSLLATKNFHSLRTSQVAIFSKVLGCYILGVALWLWWSGIYDFADALRNAAFSVTSLVTTTGFATVNYLDWSVFAGTLFLIFALTGGCTGSTSGSIKIFRWQVVFAQLRHTFITITEPDRMVPLKVGSGTVNSEVSSSIFIFFAVYCFSVAVLTMLVSICGYDFFTAFSAVIACITNTGPGISRLTGPDGNYAVFTDSVKYILSFAMILGRLEVMTVLVIFTKNFWR